MSAAVAVQAAAPETQPAGSGRGSVGAASNGAQRSVRGGKKAQALQRFPRLRVLLPCALPAERVEGRGKEGVPRRSQPSSRVLTPAGG